MVSRDGTVVTRRCGDRLEEGGVVVLFRLMIALAAILLVLALNIESYLDFVYLKKSS